MQCNGTVLVADDQPDVLEAMRLLLKGGGFAVETVTSPSAVLQCAKGAQYDAVLIDLNYTRDTTSGIEGMDLLADLRSSTSAPVIVMTAWATVDLAIEALRRGASDFIQKPWDNTQVLETIRKQIVKRTRATEALRAAKTVHDSLLRIESPQIAGMEVAVWSKPLEEIGGDYYQACETSDGKLLFCIADACGKGLSATIQMSNLQGAMKASGNETDPANLCRNLNRILRGNLPTGHFLSLFVGVVNAASGDLTYCNAGHLPPLLVRSTGALENLQTGGAVLGYFEDYDFVTGTARLEAGDSLVLYTDGVSEAADDAEIEFGDSALEKAILAAPKASSTELRDALVKALEAHSPGRFGDDATLFVIRRG